MSYGVLSTGSNVKKKRDEHDFNATPVDVTECLIEHYRDHPPKAVHPLTFRPDFSGEGRPTMDCCWCVWGDDVPFSNEPLERMK